VEREGRDSYTPLHSKTGEVQVHPFACRDGMYRQNMQIPSASEDVMDDDDDDDSVEYGEEEYNESELANGRHVEDETIVPGSRAWTFYSKSSCEGSDNSSSLDGANRKRKFPTGSEDQNLPIPPHQEAGNVKVKARPASNNGETGTPPTSGSYHQPNGKRLKEDDHHEKQYHPKGWTSAMHRQFVEAIYEIGINHASPSVIMEHMAYMSPEPVDRMDNGTGSSIDSYVASGHITSERVKSHLQKYRKNKKKSKDKFRREYDRWMQKALTIVGGLSAAARTSLVAAPTAVVEMMGEVVGDIKKESRARKQDLSKRLLGGDVPAFLTFSVLLEEEHAKVVRQEGFRPESLQYQRDTAAANAELSLLLLRNGGDRGSTKYPSFLPSAMEYAQELSGARIPLPVLTEEEQQSSLGVSISHVIGLFYSMTHTLIRERKKNQHTKTNNRNVSEANFPSCGRTQSSQGCVDDSATGPTVITPQYSGQGMHHVYSQATLGKALPDSHPGPIQERYNVAQTIPLFPSDLRYKLSSPLNKHTLYDAGGAHPLAYAEPPLHYARPPVLNRTGAPAVDQDVL
jgi:hypothetical protein